LNCHQKLYIGVSKNKILKNENITVQIYNYFFISITFNCVLLLSWDYFIVFILGEWLTFIITFTYTIWHCVGLQNSALGYFRAIPTIIIPLTTYIITCSTCRRHFLHGFIFFVWTFKIFPSSNSFTIIN
jgi:hypothetical protein